MNPLEHIVGKEETTYRPIGGRTIVNVDEACKLLDMTPQQFFVCSVRLKMLKRVSITSGSRNIGYGVFLSDLERLKRRCAA